MIKREEKPQDSMLGEEKIGKLLVKMSVPSVVGMLVHAFYNFVDTIFIGRGVGVDAIGGLAVAFPFQMLIMAIAGLVGMGAASVISRNLGAGNRERAYLTAGNTILLSILIGLCCTAVGLFFLDPILRLFGATDNLISFSREYLSIILMGALFGTFGMAANNMIRAEGKATVAMGTMLVGTLLNIILDPIFIFGFKMGIQGAAIATVISQMASATFLVLFFLTGRSSLKIRLEHFKLQLDIIKETVSIGFPSFVRQAGGSALMVVINNVLGNYGGDIYISLFGVINRFFMLVFMTIFGVVQGFQPIVGFNYGARKIGRVKEVLKLSIGTTTAICLFFFIIMELFPGQMVGIFSDDPRLAQVGIGAIRLINLALPIVGFQIIGAAFFQAIGKAKPALILGISRQFIFLIPMVILFPRFWGVNGVWLSFPIADVLSVLLTGFWFFKEVKRLDN